MICTLFEQVTLTQDVPKKNLRRGDVATIVEYHPMREGEDGYSLEVFNGIGETIAVITVPESAIQPLSADTILHVRDLKVPA
jgi:hypothetical protein